MTPRPIQLAAAVLAPIAFVAGCFSQSSGRDPGDSDRPLLVGEQCADLVVLGARGSTQDPQRNRGVGTEVRVSVEQLARRVRARSATTVRLEAVRYDAAETATLAGYQEHVGDGAAMATRRLSMLERACPDSRFVLVGFSQGAQVVHAAALNVPGGLAPRIALVAMIADPRHDPADRITQFGYAVRPVTGHGRLGAGSPIDPDLRGAAISLCVAGDEICNDRGNPGGPPSSTHRHFYEKPSSARITATQLDRVLRRNGV